MRAVEDQKPFRPVGWAAGFLVAVLLLGGCGLGGPASRTKVYEDAALGIGEGAPAPGDAADFRLALEEHTASAYETYLQRHPQGKYVGRARYWYERLSYYDAVTSRNPEDLKRFLKRFPDSNYATDAEVSLQRKEYARVRQVDTVQAYEAFIERFKNARSEWTAAAGQRLQRLYLDAAKAERSEKLLARYIYDFPKSPYIQEARHALREATFERALRSSKEEDWRAFMRKYPGTPEAERMARHIEQEALRGAERSGRAGALMTYLEHYPNSPHKQRILSSVRVMERERNQEIRRWVRVEKAEIEVFRPRRCPTCTPELRVNGSLLNTDPDFAFDLVLEVALTGKNVRTRHRVKSLRPGERRPFSFPLPEQAPRSGPPPAFQVRVVEGSAYYDGPASRRVNVEGLDEGQNASKADRFAPVPVPPLDRR